MNKYKAVLFDYDGTLADSNQVIVDSWQHMARAVIGHELSMDYIITTFGLILKDAFLDVCDKYDLPKDDAYVEDMMELYRSYQRDHIIGGYPAFPGMAKLVRDLHNNGIKIGLVTSRAAKSAYEGLDYLAILDCFDYLVCAETTDIHKPEPEPALICARELGVDPSECLMVGDSRFDIACANNAGCGSCFVSWSFSNTKDQVEEYSPATYYVDSAEEILAIVLGKK